MTNEEKLRGYVEAGAAQLSKHDPDWFNQIDLDRLDMGYCTQEQGSTNSCCVLCQLSDYGPVHGYGLPAKSYSNGKQKFGLLGFSGKPIGVWAESDWQYPILTRLWTDKILALRATSPTQS